MPEDTPLPRPMRQATRVIASWVWLNGSSRSPTDMMNIDGTDTNQRPKRSMIAPPGKNSRMSKAIEIA